VATLLKSLNGVIMIIKGKIERGKMLIDLTGPGGNAFYLLSVAKNLSKQIGLDFSKIMAEMTASDYENLIQVFDRYFGDYVDLIDSRGH